MAISILKAQDSISIYTQIEVLKTRLDSLEALLKNVDFDSLKNSLNGRQFDKSLNDTAKSEDLLSNITTFFSFNEQDQSSRRSRIDELLHELRRRQRHSACA